MIRLRIRRRSRFLVCGMFSIIRRPIAAVTMRGGSIGAGSGTLTVDGNVTTLARSSTATISGQLNLGSAMHTFDVAEGAASVDLDIPAAVSGVGSALTKTGDGMLRML